MAPALWKALLAAGLLALAHAAFSAAQHRSYMRLTEEEEEPLPADIVLQTLLAFALACYGTVHAAGEFRDVDAASELRSKTAAALRSRPSFSVFNHRARVLFRSSGAALARPGRACGPPESPKLGALRG
uniref:ER membrane protein complex subunit 5-like n=1 Tax=Jaculus jaculus TaxID=51337 RepID=UPI001E1B5DEE|nr:ER membrane protein complex subunit 5-like [Jaculus jaculus]